MTSTPTIGPPNAPFGLTAVPGATSDRVELNWSHDGLNVTGFYVERCDGGVDVNGNCPTGWKQIADLVITPGNETTPATLAAASETPIGTIALAGLALVGLAGAGWYLKNRSDGGTA